MNIGDKVKFLNDAGGGIITQLIDKESVMVLSDIDDFEIPVLKKELIIVTDTNKIQSNIANETVVEESKNSLQTLSLLFSVKKEVYILQLYNPKSQTFVFGIYHKQKEVLTGIFSGMVSPNSCHILCEYSLTDIENISGWYIQGFFYEKEQKELRPPVNTNLKIRPVQLLKNGNKAFVEEIKTEAVVFSLETKTDDLIPITAGDLFAKDTPSPKIKKERKGTRQLLEVDLHIHELLDDTRNMSANDMLEYQLEYFRKIIEENKKYKGKKIVFIHGVGNGVLKQRIRHELQKFPQLMVQDASFQEYGWGATMVIIR